MRTSRHKPTAKRVLLSPAVGESGAPLASNLAQAAAWPSMEEIATIELDASLVAVHAEGPVPGAVAIVNAVISEK